ncbi:bifunctional diaminohydroxyphosphoribosylaminopyrimidine deaminase/5-amino-6-(5-phosphoribosylamino)uracil reductase RibD [Candidatus Peregrinibacteria bacterium]|nr:bifunctional diaminohydroxyphosphoribosylaminopyrimidine deaminase/5-amino-6-(5-phosphoribosylamino)uracil reductase RibD [Candidatus Peregrinibacteria bacterium]
MPTSDEKFMVQALKLATLGGRDVAPNPMVGAVIVKNGKVIGKGYHKKFGGPHAEVNAIKSVKNKKDLIGSTIYVTLEPCQLHGKTPPCSELIKKVGISKVICGSKDPFQPKSNYKILKGEIADKCVFLNKFFFTWVTKKRPFITVKIAVSADGFVAGKGGAPVRITNKKQDIEIHKLRAFYQAIMVGSNTVLSDNPHLGVRLVKGKDPLRIILDSKNRVPKTAKVFRDKNYLHINKKTTLNKLFAELAKKEISSILVEPGPTLYRILKKEKLIDELIVFTGKKNIKAGLKISF